MNKCFITKLPSSVDNDNLPVLGQLRFNWLKQSNLTDNDIRAIELSTNDSITIKVSGAHLTDNTLSSNLGNTKTITAADGLVRLYVSNDADAVLTIDNKYSLSQLNFIKKDVLGHSVYFDIEDIRYCTNLIILHLANMKVSGDISAVKNLTNLTDLNFSGTKVNGDISAVKNITNIQKLILEYTQISGDISALSKLTNLTDLIISSTNISGTFDNLTSLTKLEQIWAMETLVTGDMSKIPGNCNTIWLSSVNSATVCTWSAKSRQNVKMLMIDGEVNMDTTSIDNMLIDQATCKFNISEYQEWNRTIHVNGTRTSASDAAVTAIQNMGVTITGITKAS